MAPPAPYNVYSLARLITPAMIYHIAPKQDIHRQKGESHYRTASLIYEGFIHCSERNQLVGSTNNYFRGQSGLVVLCIDESKLRSEMRYEDTTGSGRLFPHIYGPLNSDAIVKVLDIPVNAKGNFELPDELA